MQGYLASSLTPPESEEELLDWGGQLVQDSFGGNPGLRAERGRLQETATGYYRSSPLIFACDGGRAEVEIYHLPGQTSMVELPRGLEDFSLHVVTSNALTSTELMLSSWEWGGWKKLRTEELKKVHQHVGWRKLYDPELNKFLVSHRDGSVNDEETEGHLGNLTLVYSGEMPMEWLEVKGRLPTQLLLLLRCHSGSPGYSETKLRYSYTGAAPCASPAPQGCAGLNTSEALEALDAWRAWAHARYGSWVMPRGLRWCWWKVVEVPGTVLVAPLAKQGLLPWSRFEAFWGHMPEAPRWQPAAHLLDHNRDHCLSRREFDHAFGGHTRLPRVRGVRVGGWEEMQLLTAAWVTLTLCACWLVICRLQISRGREPAYAPVPSVEDLPPNPPEKVELPEKAAERWIAAGELPPAPDHTHLLDHPAPPPRKRWLNEHPPGTFGSLLAQSREKGDQKMALGLSLYDGQRSLLHCVLTLQLCGRVDGRHEVDRCSEGGTECEFSGGPSGEPHKIGYLQSANVCGRIVTSTFWGCVAQRYGPKPVLLCALFSILLGSILFGFCTNLAAAMGVRFLFLGVLNGWPALFGPCAAACAGDHRQTEVLGFILAAGSGMQLVGPSIGGWTYGWVPSFPAVLPSTIGCVLTVVALALFARVHRAFGTSGASASAEGSVGSPSKSRGAQRSVLCQWPVPLVLWMRLCNGFALFGLFEATPLWLISDRELGGLGMSDAWQVEKTKVHSETVVRSLIYFPYVLPTCTKRFGCRTCAALMSVIACGLAIALPFARSMPLVNVLHMLASSSFQSQAALNVSFTNNAAGTEGRALVTGVAVTCETLGKASAPVVMSYLFAGFLRHYGEAGHGLVFFIMAALSVMELLCTLCLPSSVEDAWEHERVPVEHDPVPAEKVLPAKIGLENPEMNALHRRLEALGHGAMVLQLLALSGEEIEVELADAQSIKDVILDAAAVDQKTTPNAIHLRARVATKLGCEPACVLLVPSGSTEVVKDNQMVETYNALTVINQSFDSRLIRSLAEWPLRAVKSCVAF
eukprot:g18243.t1